MFKTPSFETIQDKKREDRVAGFLEGLWKVSCHKLPVSYGIDYWIESADKWYWCEIKCRSFASDKYDTFILYANKLRKGASFSQLTGHPFITVYGMTDGIWMHESMPDFVYDIRMNKNPTPNYDEDNEPYIHIPKEHLTCLSDVPLGFDRDEIGLI